MIVKLGGGGQVTISALGCLEVGEKVSMVECGFVALPGQPVFGLIRNDWALTVATL